MYPPCKPYRHVWDHDVNYFWFGTTIQILLQCFFWKKPHVEPNSSTLSLLWMQYVPCNRKHNRANHFHKTTDFLLSGRYGSRLAIVPRDVACTCSLHCSSNDHSPSTISCLTLSVTLGLNWKITVCSTTFLPSLAKRQHVSLKIGKIFFAAISFCRPMLQSFLIKSTLQMVREGFSLNIHTLFSCSCSS